MASLPDIRFEAVTDPAALAVRWRALEASADGGFFRSWTYLGGLLPHVSAPMLLAVQDAGQDLVLGLFSRRHGRLFLHEAGEPAWDRLYVEHNGCLVRRGHEDVLPAALAAALRHGPLVLSGVDAAHAAAAHRAGAVELRKRHVSPASVLPGSGDVLAGISANARAQIRRSMRLYGPSLAIDRAADTGAALRFFERLVALHQASWRARGQAGAFGDPAIRAWHAALIREGVPRGEVTLLRIAAGAREVGYLYQFEQGGRVFCYQSGFASESDARLKPGLVCHVLAMEEARGRGLGIYDLLAGSQRYKRTLAPAGGGVLSWIVLRRAGSWGARWAWVRGATQGLKRQGRTLPPDTPS
jgi:CelD/BcsL family acetyltransferase involved in cellulose biosynthesis